MHNRNALTDVISDENTSTQLSAAELADIPLVAISGYPETGKTSLIEKLTSELKKRGYRVATIKHTHHALGDPGKDTERHIAAGAAESLLVNDARMALIKPAAEYPSMREILRLLGDDQDIVLCEGFKASNLPKIAVVKSADELRGMSQVIGVITDLPLSREVPCFGQGDIIPLANMLEQTYILPRQGRINVFVNGKKIPLTPFPKAVIAQGITGLLSALKGVEDIRHIEITMAHPSKIAKP